MMRWDDNKKTIQFLRVGQLIWATVEEILDSQTAIVELYGDLLRVTNQSGVLLRAKQRVQLVVTASAPLEFRILSSTATKSRSAGKIDVEV